jgi:UDP-glucose:(heptosyl)LPS alpha-1,3-glucosyltransferase
VRIGLICRNFLSNRGGLENYTISTAHELSERGHEVHIFSHRAENHRGFSFHKVPILPISSPCKNLSFAVNASKIALRQDLHIVQSMERVWKQDIFRASDGINPIQLAQRYSNPKVRKFKALMPRRQVLTFLENQIFKGDGALSILTNSQLIKNQIISFYGTPENKIYVIYNGVDTERFRPDLKTTIGSKVRAKYGIKDDDLLILFAGNDFRQKGLNILFKAVSIINSEKIKVMAAGSDTLSNFKELAKEAVISGSAIFLGHQPKLELFYAASDLFVLPTLYDPFANVCLEAMACGVPVITTKTNGASEIIENGSTGFILESSTAEELSAHINKFYIDSDRSRMSLNASEKAAFFSTANHMEALLDLYKKTLEKKRTEWM